MAELDFLQGQLLRVINRNANPRLIKRLKEGILNLQSVDSEGKYLATVKREFEISTTDSKLVMEIGDIIYLSGDSNE